MTSTQVPDDEGEWEARKDAPSTPLPYLLVSRASHAAVVLPRSNAVLVVGGVVGGVVAGERVSNTTERLDPGADAWQVGPTFPTARKECGACVVGDEVIVVAGKTSNDVECSVVEAVNVVSGAHRTLPPLPRDLRGCGVVSLQGVVIATGGVAGITTTNSVWALDVGGPTGWPRRRPAWTTLPEMLFDRSHHGVAAGDGRVFVCGGHNFVPMMGCEMLTVRGGQAQGNWERLPRLPACGWFNHGCCYGGGNLFVVAGSNLGELSTHVVVALNVATNQQWDFVAVLSTHRAKCAAVCVGRRVLVLGGHRGQNSRLLGCEAVQF